MEKKTYYVSVQSKLVLENQGDSAYELEIEATPEQVHQLHELFESENESDFANYIRMHSPEILEEELITHAFVDQYLTEAYRLIHQFGTPKTKAFVESINVLDGLQHGYRSDF
ncbi:hypothetical protein MO973_24260 [Paenibacillus sp. TRM 82003]|nr:hypothetical protein [Paenibacillus sp. TRM 82003]